VPLWKVTLQPSTDPILDHFLSHVSGFDMMANERAIDVPIYLGDPKDWTSKDNPNYSTWMYYLWINITALNYVRRMLGKNTFAFRAHCGEGPLQYLGCAFLTAAAIVGGTNLTKDPALEYLYYLGQVPLSMSPISSEFSEYLQHPFPNFFKRGLMVSLASHFPLQFHHTQEPLVEEYSIASKLWKLSPTDLCEISRYSVLQSEMDHELKKKWLGPTYVLHSSIGNDPKFSNLPSVRVAYRFETYHAECNQLEKSLPHGTRLRRRFYTLEEEDKILQEMKATPRPTRVESLGSFSMTLHSDVTAPYRQDSSNSDIHPSLDPENLGASTSTDVQRQLEDKIRDLERRIESLSNHTTINLSSGGGGGESLGTGITIQYNNITNNNVSVSNGSSGVPRSGTASATPSEAEAGGLMDANQVAAKKGQQTGLMPPPAPYSTSGSLGTLRPDPADSAQDRDCSVLSDVPSSLPEMSPRAGVHGTWNPGTTSQLSPRAGISWPIDSSTQQPHIPQWQPDLAVGPQGSACCIIA